MAQGLAAVPMALPAAAWGLPVDDDAQRWLARHAAPIRSLDAADDDFRDLAPFAQAIGQARVVQLGEPGHGAGTCFAAKVRLIKFLHQRLGFDVVLWESGLYDVDLTEAALRAGEDPVAAARRGVFALWANAAEVAPLFGYAQDSLRGGRPLAMAGLDMQVSARGSVERFATDLRALAAGIGDAAARSRTAKLAEEMIAARARVFAAMQPADLGALGSAVDGLLEALRAQRAPIAAGIGTARLRFMTEAIENVRADARNRVDRKQGSASPVELENRRDARNAELARWLIDDVHAGRRIIIWAHNAHIMNAYYGADFRSVHLAPAPDRMKPTGVWLREWLGDDLYTLGTTAYAGVDQWAAGGKATTIDPAPEASLEERLHRLGHAQLFLDLRGAARHRVPALAALTTARIPKYDTVPLADIARPYDGLVYIDRMAAATRIAEAAP